MGVVVALHARPPAHGTSLVPQLIQHAINNGDFLNHLNQLVHAPHAHWKQVQNLAVTQQHRSDRQM